MKAGVGDRVVVRRHRAGDVERHGEILEVRGKDGDPPFLVRWSDGRESILVPGPEAAIEPRPAGGARRSKRSSTARRR